MKRIQIVLAAAILLALTAGSAMAVTDSASSVTLTTTVPSKATLTLTGNTTPAFDLTLVDTGTPVTAAAATTVSAKVRTAYNGAPTLTVKANTDFVNAASAAYNIPAGDVSWAGTGGLAATGTLSKTVEGTVNGGWTGSGTYGGDMTWTLANNSNYQAGTYGSIVVGYTLTAP